MTDKKDERVPFAVAIARVAAALPTDEEDERIVGEAVAACQHPASEWLHITSWGDGYSCQRLATWCKICGALNTGAWRLPERKDEP